MTLKITLLLSLCAGNVNMTAVKAKQEALQKEFPDAKVTVSLAKKCEKAQ